MKLSIHVITRASRNEIKQLSDTEFKIWVTTVPEDGKANKKILSMLSKHLGIAKSNMVITLGKTSKTKVVEVLL